MHFNFYFLYYVQQLFNIRTPYMYISVVVISPTRYMYYWLNTGIIPFYEVSMLGIGRLVIFLYSGSLLKDSLERTQILDRKYCECS